MRDMQTKELNLADLDGRYGRLRVADELLADARVVDLVHQTARGTTIISHG